MLPADRGYRGIDAWRAMQARARAAGGDLSPLIDMSLEDRRARWDDLLQGDFSGERKLAFHQMAAAELAGIPLSVLAGFVPPQPLPPLPGPDRFWQPLDGGPFAMVSRRKGHLLVVREVAMVPGHYFTTVDGYRLFWRGGPPAYPRLEAALDAADEAIRHPIPTYLEYADD